MSFAELVVLCTTIFNFAYYMAIVLVLLGSAITVGLMYRVMCWSSGPLVRHVALGCTWLARPVCRKVAQLLYWLVLVPCIVLGRLIMFPFRNMFRRVEHA